jgi:serine/threonine protein kinase
VEQCLGRGAFGQVVKCIDLKEGGRAVALKISKCSNGDVNNAMQEARYLKRIHGEDPLRRHSIVDLLDDFKFRQHYVLVFEVLGENLYEHIKSPKFKGMKTEQLRSVAKELLIALQKLRSVGIIHCDLKPENIMFTDADCQKVKIIDFGASTEKFESRYTYVQSRFYRSPEVTIGIPYDAAIDMWSFGCIMAELCTTRALFPAHDELDLLERMRITIGMPPQWMMEGSNKRNKFIDRNGKLIRSQLSNLQPGLPDRSHPISRQVYTAFDDDFTDFLEVSIQLLSDPPVL